MTFKKNDQIKCINLSDYAGSDLTVGKVYTVLRDQEGSSCVYISTDDCSEYAPYAYRFELAKKDNGMDANGDPLHIGEADLKPFQRVVFQANESGGGGIVVVDGDGKLGVYCNNGGWVNVLFDSKEKFSEDYNIVEVYAAPALWDAMDRNEKGPLIWKRGDAAQFRAIKEADAAVAEAEAALHAARTARAAL